MGNQISKKTDPTTRSQPGEEFLNISERLNLALESAQMGIWELDLLTDTAYRNLRHDQIFGFKTLQPEWGYEIFLKHVFPEDLEHVKRTFEESLARGNFAMECRIIWPDQSIHWIAAQGRVFRDSKGQLVKMMGAVTDATERKQSEQALRASEHRTRLVIDTALNAFISIDSQSRIIDWNPQSERTFGWSREEAMNRSLPELLIPRQYRESHRQGLQHFLKTGEGPLLNQRFEITALHRDGHEFPVEVAITPIRVGIDYVFNAFLHDISDRKRAEALRESEQQYRLLFDANPSPMWVYDRESFKFLAVNSAAIQHYGYSLEEFTSMSTTDIRPEKERERFLATHAKKGPRSLSDQGIWRHRIKDGSVIEVQITSQDIIFHGREALLVLAHDITSQLNAERALKTAEQKYRSIFENSVEGIFQTTPEGKYLVANPALAHMLGFDSPKELMESTSNIAHQEYVNPQERDRMIARLREEGILKKFQYETYRKDGSRIWVSEDVRAVYGGDGRVEYYEGTVQDVTSINQAQEGLKQSEERYRLLFDSNPQALWVSDPKTLKFLAVNESAARLHGFPREELLSMTLHNVRASEKWDTPAHKDDGKNRQVWKHLKKDGTTIDVEIESHPLSYAGRPATLTLATDITQRLVLEQQFRQAQKMEAVGRLAGGVAHDFNNILGVILGNSELLESSVPSNNPLQKKIGEIIKAVNRASSLTRQLLAFSRQQVLQAKVIDLNTTVKEMEQLLHRLIGEDITMEMTLDPGLGMVKADPGQVEQILMNLAVNSRDAMPKGGRIIIETTNVTLDALYASRHVVTSPGDYIQLTVSDTGTGMDRKTQSHIFEPFFTTKERGKGTGLGLAMVYGIVKQSGGYIWVYSEVGQGTTFKIYFPRINETADIIAKVSGEAPTAKGEAILVVEDEPALRATARDFLQLAGYVVLDAGSPAEAESLCNSHQGRIDLLLTDVVMPGRSGRQLAEQLATSRPNMKVLYMTGYTDDMIVHHGVLETGVALIEKPFSRHSLLNKVRAVLDETQRKTARGAAS